MIQFHNSAQSVVFIPLFHLRFLCHIVRLALAGFTIFNHFTFGKHDANSSLYYISLSLVLWLFSRLFNLFRWHHNGSVCDVWNRTAKRRLQIVLCFKLFTRMRERTNASVCMCFLLGLCMCCLWHMHAYACMCVHIGLTHICKSIRTARMTLHP